MVVLNRIYTRTGDKGDTALGSGERVAKNDLRIEAYGTVDETNATVGIVRLHTATPELAKLDAMLARIQNDLFDLGADLCVPDSGKDLGYEPLRIVPAQTIRLEDEIDELNAALEPLRSAGLAERVVRILRARIPDERLADQEIERRLGRLELVAGRLQRHDPVQNRRHQLRIVLQLKLRGLGDNV